MRRVFALSLLAPFLVLAWSAPARAAGTVAPPAIMVISLLADDEPLAGLTVPQDDEGRFVRLFVAAAAGISVNGEVRGDPDPVIDYSLTVESAAEEAVQVDYTIVMPIVELMSISAVSASLDVTVVDADGSGSALVGAVAPTLQMAMASEGGSTAQSLGVDVGTSTGVPGASYSAGPIPGPAPRPAEGPTFVEVSILGSFTLSPGDRATLVGNVTVLPEPGAALLLAFGLAGLAALRHTRA